MLYFLYFLLPAFLILRLRRPRHRCIRWCASPVSPPVLRCACFLAAMSLSLLSPFVPAGEVIKIAGQILVAAGTLLAWFFLTATRRWAAEPSWIDRLGRILGALWMVSFPAHLVLIRLCD